MGGRLDSTNIITPVLSVITNIGHDHMEFLGSRLADVAAEKGGIIKPGIPVVIGESHDETAPVFKDIARRSGSPIFFADQNFGCDLGNLDMEKESRQYTIIRKSDGNVTSGDTPLGGDYQSRNLVTLVQALSIIDTRFKPTAEQIAVGITFTKSNTGLLGRWQILRHNPLVVCDTAHNMEGISFVMNQIRGMKYESLHMVIGVVNDKDLSSILPLFPVDGKYYFTKASIPRALDEKVLKAEAEKYRLSGTCFPDVASAYQTALLSAGKNDLIFIGGSTFVVAEVV